MFIKRYLGLVIEQWWIIAALILDVLALGAGYINTNLALPHWVYWVIGLASFAIANLATHAR